MASRREVLAEMYEAAAGPLSWTDDPDVAVGECGGRQVRFEPYLVRVGGGDNNTVLRGARVSVDLGGRVITAEIHNRKRTSFALPEVRTEDPEFDELFVVYGWPEKSIRDGLDDDTRRWLTETWPHGFPPVSVEGRWLQGRFGVFGDSSTPEISTDEFRSLVEELVGFGTGLIEAYDQERADEARFGDEAASAWEQNLVGLETQRRGRRKTVRAVVFASLALLVAVVLVAVVYGCGVT